MSYVLGIDTSSIDLGIGLYKDNSPQASICRYVRNSHAEHITNAVKMVFELGGISARHISHIVISNGPGSFTGLRIGLSFVKGFCIGTTTRILSLSSLHVLAHAVGGEPGRRIFTALDARQNQIHWAGFKSSAKGVERIFSDQLSSADELMNVLSPEDLLVTDTMGYAKSTVFQQFIGKAELHQVENSHLQRGLSCAAIGKLYLDMENKWTDAMVLEPNYMRSPAAQEKVCL